MNTDAPAALPPPPGELYRKQHGVSLADIAKSVQMTPQYVRRLELHGAPNLYCAEKLARAYAKAGGVPCRVETFLRRKGDAIGRTQKINNNINTGRGTPRPRPAGRRNGANS